jgi:hypothetical protein
MVIDLKSDSANYANLERSGTRGSPHSDHRGFGYKPNKPLGSYSDSQIHQSRQHWGPTAPVVHTEQPAPVTATQAPYTGQHGQGYSQSQATQATLQNQYATASSGYNGYQQPTQTTQATYGGGIQAAPSPAISQYSSSSGGTQGGAQHYTHTTSSYGTDSRASSGGAPYQQPGQDSRVPRDPRYAAPAPRYFGHLRPEFLVYD